MHAIMTPHLGSHVALLLSGGLDSSILLTRYLAQGYSVQPIYIVSGLCWEAAEQRAIACFLSQCDSDQLAPLVSLKVPVTDLYGNHWSLSGNGTPSLQSADDAVHLPGRNLLLLSKSAIWCQLNGISKLAIATLGTSPFSDATVEAIRAVETAACVTDCEFAIEMPFADWDKRRVMALAKEIALQHTYSCIAPSDERHCGRCNKCAERRQAFLIAGIPDPSTYLESRSHIPV